MTTRNAKYVTPYVDEDNSGVYIKTSEADYKQARWEAIDMAETSFSTCGRTKYIGKKKVGVHDHDDWEYCEDYARCWHECYCFEIYEGTARYR